MKIKYTDELIERCTPIFKQGLRYIYSLSKQKSDLSKHVLRTFQEKLQAIPKWNSMIITKEYDRFKINSNCLWLDKLVKASFIAEFKHSTSKSNSAKIKLDIPKSQDFIHICYIEIARSLWCKPQLMFEGYQNDTRKINDEEINMIIREKINKVIKDLLPLEQMVSSFLKVEEEIYNSDDDEKHSVKGGGDVYEDSSEDEDGDGEEEDEGPDWEEDIKGQAATEQIETDKKNTHDGTNGVGSSDTEVITEEMRTIDTTTNTTTNPTEDIIEDTTEESSGHTIENIVIADEIHKDEELRTISASPINENTSEECDDDTCEESDDDDHDDQILNVVETIVPGGGAIDENDTDTVAIDAIATDVSPKTTEKSIIIDDAIFAQPEIETNAFDTNPVGTTEVEPVDIDTIEKIAKTDVMKDCDIAVVKSDEVAESSVINMIVEVPKQNTSGISDTKVIDTTVPVKKLSSEDKIRKLLGSDISAKEIHSKQRELRRALLKRG